MLSADGDQSGVTGAPTWHRVASTARQFGIAWVTLALFVVLSMSSQAFLTAPNLVNILDQQATVLIVGAAVTLTMIAGNFDISLSAIFALAAVAAVQVENATGSIPAAVAAALFVGLAAGAINGFIVVVGKVNSFIGTLATSFVFFGLGYVVSQQSILSPDNPAFAEIARTRWLGVTAASWIAIVFVVILAFVLSQTRFGRHIFAVGTNKEAARLSGVRAGRVQFSTFVLGGFAAALAGLLATSRVMSAQASDDYGLIFVVITAIIVGGTSISGGQGAIWRTVVGVFFIAFVGNGFDLLGVDPIYQRMIRGAIILAAVWIDANSSGRILELHFPVRSRRASEPPSDDRPDPPRR